MRYILPHLAQVPFNEGYLNDTSLSRQDEFRQILFKDRLMNGIEIFFIGLNELEQCLNDTSRIISFKLVSILLTGGYYNYKRQT